MKLKKAVEAAQFSKDAVEKIPLYKSEKYEIRVICFEKGQALPLHVHRDADEIFHVVKGSAEITVGSETWTTGHGAMVIGKAGIEHSVKNSGGDQLIIRSLFIPPA